MNCTVFGECVVKERGQESFLFLSFVLLSSNWILSDEIYGRLWLCFTVFSAARSCKYFYMCIGETRSSVTRRGQCPLKSPKSLIYSPRRAIIEKSCKGDQSYPDCTITWVQFQRYQIALCHSIQKLLERASKGIS